MKTIIKDIDRENDLTIFTNTGKVFAQDIVAAIKDFYTTTATSKVLWDLSQSDLSEIKSAEIEQIVELSNHFAKGRSHGKTAIVALEAFSFGLSRMYELSREPTKMPVETRTFRNKQDAYEWLLSD